MSGRPSLARTAHSTLDRHATSIVVAFLAGAAR
jgi:hypothetical protein